MLKLKITSIGTPKDVNTVHGVKQKNYLKAEEYNDKFLNFWVNGVSKNWKVGDVIEVESVDERDYTDREGNLKKSYDIKLPKFQGNNPELTKKVDEILSYLAKMNLGMAELLEWKRQQDKPKIQGTDIDYPMPEDEGIVLDDEIGF